MRAYTYVVNPGQHDFGNAQPLSRQQRPGCDAFHALATVICYMIPGPGTN